MEINKEAILDRFKKSGPRSERAELIGRIEAFTNPSRIKAGYRPYQPGYIAALVCHLNLADLRDHVVQAEKADNPSRYFYGLLKPKYYANQT